MTLNADITSAALISVRHQVVKSLELSAPLQKNVQPGEVQKNKYVFQVTPTNRLSSHPHICRPKYREWLENFAYLNTYPMSLEDQLSNLSLLAVLLIPFVYHVHSHQYSWFIRIFSTVAYRWRKSTSLPKYSVSITKLVNIGFKLMPCI